MNTARRSRAGHRPHRPANGPVRRRPAGSTRPAPYPTKKGSGRSRTGRRAPYRTFGEQISNGAASEVRKAIRLGLRATALAALAVAVLAVGCVARLTGHVPDQAPSAPTSRAVRR